ncbi:MAG TPA: hypothetical protein PLD25_16355 [Chloroflexota bacterium]|nr:hypothetical protein [Chloroflexota bacterium]HUM71905.1 hypothetical protein [Chloroflexota bacterium]
MARLDSLAISLCYNPPMPNDDKKLDKELYRWAQEQIREWNLAEQRDRYLTAHERTPEKSWQEYLSLWEFARRRNYKQSLRQQSEKHAALVGYYERVQKLEAWRSASGRKP